MARCSEYWRSANYFEGALTALDISTIPGVSGLPAEWAASLGLDSPFANGVASALAQTGLMERIENLESAYPATNLDGFYRTAATPTGIFKLSRSDLEKATILVPTISQIRVGDLLVHYGIEEGQSRDSLKVGIIVYVPSSGVPAAGEDPTEYLKQVVLVGANEGDRQVSLMTWISNGTSKGFTEDSPGAHARRLVATSAPVQAQTLFSAKSSRAPLTGDFETMSASGEGESEDYAKTIAKWGAAKIRFSYNNSFDCSYTGSTYYAHQAEIPNTGEYLAFTGMRVIVEDARGHPINLAKELRDIQYSLFLTADDPGDSIGRPNNQGSGFELGGRDNLLFDLPETRSLGTFARTASGHAEIGKQVDSSSSINFSLDKHGKLFAEYSQLGSLTKRLDIFGIRPVIGSVTIGDDLVLGIKMQISFQDIADGLIKKSLSSNLQSDEAFVVYDKKERWISELLKAEPENSDYNSLFPWNAPPAPGLTVKGGANPAWGRSDQRKPNSWDVLWGYNPLNYLRVAKPSDPDYDELVPGDGTQRRPREYTIPAMASRFPKA